MKKSLFVIITLIVFTLLPGCMKNEFSIRFEFPKDYLGNYIVDYYAWNSKRGSWVEAVAPLQNGVADVRCGTGLPTLVYIRDASSSANSIVVYAEKGDEIIVSGDKNDMNTWTVKGNKISQRWSEWRNKNADVFSKSGDKFTKEKEKAISDFISDNKDDKLSTLILLTEWNRRENPDGFLKLWNQISEDAKSSQFLEMTGCTDLLGVEFEVDAKGNLSRTKEKKHKQMIVRSSGNGVDTLRFGRVKSSLLFFYGDNDSGREDAIDSIKALVKAYPDSAKRIITDICLRPDSMSWVNATRRDSVKTVVRAWTPQGIASQDIINLGVSRYPWFMVIRKDGSDAYSGPDLKDAVAAFRKEMDKKAVSKAKESPRKPQSSPNP